MARAAVKAKQQARAQAQPSKAARTHGRRKHAGGGNPNQQLFFSRLRRGQKWLYLLLAIIFAIGFAGIGLGSGTGNGFSDLYAGIFGSGNDPVSKAQSEIAKNPAKGYLDLATAYETKGDDNSAITALQSYLNLKKNDATEWEKLGGLEQQQGDQFATAYQQAQQAQQAADPSAVVQPAGALGQAFGTNPIDQYYAQQASSQGSQFYQSATSAYSQAVSAYQKAEKLQPRNAEAAYLVATAAQRDGQSAIELTALKRYLTLDPSSPYSKQIKAAIKSLEASTTPSSGAKK